MKSIIISLIFRNPSLIFRKIQNLTLLAASQFDGVNLGEQLKLRNGEAVQDVYNTPGKIVNLLVSNLFLIAGIVIFVLIIGAGFSYFQDTSKGKDEARNLATGAVLGFIIMFAAYWIVQIVAAITGADIPL
ncbi:MAG: hypothetical protein U9O78_04905 [Patescibacteria group bacterium]|nr:hypothetical protein [Patescibacteria group bacterium]